MPEVMKLFVLVASLMVFALGCGPVNGQSATDDPARAEQILENLKLQFPQLRDHSVVMEPLRDSGLDGIFAGTFVINGQQQQQFLVSEDNTKLYLVAAGPLDVSLTSEEIAAQMEEERAAVAQAAQERSAQLASSIEGLPVRGNPDAPVTIIEFSDFQCPYCARGFRTVEQILEKYPEDVNFVFMHFPLPNHPWARPASIAATCAANQDEAAYWMLHDQYFNNQSQFTPENVIPMSRAYLTGQGIDLDTWEVCAADEDSDAYQAAATVVDNAMEAGRELGVTGTPGFFVNGHFINGAKPLAEFEAVIEEAKANAQ